MADKSDLPIPERHIEAAIIPEDTNPISFNSGSLIKYHEFVPTLANFLTMLQFSSANPIHNYKD